MKPKPDKKLQPYGLGRLKGWQAYGFTMLVTAATLALRLAFDGPLGGRPTLVIFTMPIMLSAYVGGLRAGLLATALSYFGASYYLLPPLRSFAVASSVERWQQFFVVLAGVLISVLNEALHRARRRADIATREHQEAEEDRKRFFILSQDVLCILGFDGYFKDVNPAWERTLGYTSAEILATPFIEFVHPDDRQFTLAEAEKVSGGKALLAFENRYRCKDGSYRLFQWSVTPVVADRVMYGVARDITERKQAELESERRRAELQFILDAVPALVFYKDREGRFVRVNSELAELLRVPAESFIGKTDAEMGAGDNSEPFRNDDLHVMTTGESIRHQEERVHTPEGDRWLLTDKLPHRDEAGHIIGIIGFAVEITERKLADAALRDSEQKLRKVIDGLGPNSFLGLLSVEGVLIEANRPGLVAAGLRAEDVLGKPFDQTYWWSYSEPVREQLRAAMARAAAGEPSRYNVQVRVAGDNLVWIDFSLNPVRDADGRVIYVVPAGNVIEERVRAEEALLQAGALQKAIFNSANFSSIATDAKGVIQIFNVGAERMLGYTAAEVVNKITPADLHDPQEVIARAAALSIECGTPIAPGFEALVFKASRGIEDIYELTKVRKDGSRFPAVVSVTVLRDGQDVVIGYLLIGTDNTARQQVEEDRKRFEKALQETNVKLELAVAVAEKANLAKSDFLSSMSHELRTPLNAILGFAQLMESASPAPTTSQTRSIAQILQAGWYLLKLINEVLDLAVIESGKVSLSKETVSLAELMAECHSMMEPEAQQRGIRMTFPQFETPVFVTADRTRLKQIVINLLSNAIKYNEEQGTVAVECAAGVPGRVCFSVRDTGAGLPPERLAQLFTPFNRLGQESSSVAGTGIGLVVSKRLAELMDGTIGVESTVGVGSVFWCEMPSAEAPLSAGEGSGFEALAQAEASDEVLRRTLLYVEDNPANMQLVEELIGRFPDLKLITAANGTLGIKLARATQPEVILMDINLPGISGIKALKILREDPATAHIPVIALSANAMPRDIAKGLEAGFFRYLTKPIKIKELMETLNTALEFAEETAAAGQLV